MKRKPLLVGLVVLFLWVSGVGISLSSTLAAEKLDFSTSFKFSVEMSLASMAAEDRGFWRENGLEVKWTSFGSAGEFARAMAAGSIKFGLEEVSSAVFNIARGLPQLIVADLHTSRHFYLWVLGGGPVKEPKDLKGTKIALIRFGDATHVFAQVIMKGLGLEKETKFVAVGSVLAQLAALKRGTVAGSVQARSGVAKPALEGEIRELASGEDFLPKKWVAHIAVAHQDLIKTKPDVVRKAVKAIIAGKDSVTRDRTWAREKLMSYFGHSAKEADYLLSYLKIGSGGDIDLEAMRNMMNFMIEYGVLEKEKAPPVEQTYTTAFLK